ncbi:MAG: 3-deoxy-manno-octulosonate cytidylyltransferase [Lentisphaeraceae bacterium]|nr:3-deoxy-manno-octulosonate cytidylyltransferase [Lentisphaeraceae bacterium]
MNKTVAVIPARYASTRFPGKPLVKIAGKPMIQWTCEKAAASRADKVLVATDDLRIKECVEACGFEAVMTSEDHQSGTDRIAEAVKNIAADIVINLQGDEPMLPATVINQLIDTMAAMPSLEMATIAVPSSPESEEYRDPNTVKVVTDIRGRALYFSRSPLPFFRNKPEHGQCLLHWGIYAYRRDFLEKFITWPQSGLEKTESLEQLRALENGADIQVSITNEKALGVDVPEDLEKVEQFLKQKQSESDD